MAMPVDAVREAFRTAEVEQAFWEANYKQFLALYPDRFVAVLNGCVIATDADLLQLIRTLEAMGHPTADVRIRFIASDPKFLLH